MTERRSEKVKRKLIQNQEFNNPFIQSSHILCGKSVNKIFEKLLCRYTWQKSNLNIQITIAWYSREIIFEWAIPGFFMFYFRSLKAF